MTDGEERASKRIKSALRSPPEHGLVAPQNTLNLCPKFETFVDGQIEAMQLDVPQGGMARDSQSAQSVTVRSV